MLNPSVDKIKEKIDKVYASYIEDRNSILEQKSEQQKIVESLEQDLLNSASESDVKSFMVIKENLKNAQTKIEMLDLKLNNSKANAKMTNTVNQLRDELLKLIIAEESEKKAKIISSLATVVKECEAYKQLFQDSSALFNFIDTNIVKDESGKYFVQFYPFDDICQKIKFFQELFDRK